MRYRSFFTFSLLWGAILGKAEEKHSGLQAGKAVDFSKQIVRDLTPLQARGQMVLSYADVVEKARDSVVTVLVSHPRPKADVKDEEESVFDLYRKNNRAKEVEIKEPQSSGSGVIFSAEGWVVTNAHVVKDSEKIEVRLRGQDDTLPAFLAGIDVATDLALLKIEHANLSPATLGDSSQLRPGDIALAIGSPFGLEQSITLGIISATGRGNLGLINDGMEDFIQTDAAINPGNSGGPLLDGLGRVIGINTARYWGDNVGFAVPINLTLKVSRDLHQHGRVVRGFLGMQTLELTPRLRGELKLPPHLPGVVVKNVEVNEAAAKAGFLPGDLILQVNGRRIENGPRFRLSLVSLQPGDTATFKVLRGGIETTLQATMGEPPEFKKSQESTALGESVEMELAPGLRVAEVNRDWRLKLKLSSQVQGLIVIQEFKTAEGTRRLSVGDQILWINGKPVYTLKDAKSQLDSLKSPTLMLKIRGADGERFVAVAR